jgi:hypothetical protein
MEKINKPYTLAYEVLCGYTACYDHASKSCIDLNINN